MRQLTIRGFDPELTRRIREIAKRERISLNKAALRLLRRGAGIAENAEPPNTIGNSLDRFIGTMTAEEERQLLDSIRSCEAIDPGMWR